MRDPLCEYYSAAYRVLLDSDAGYDSLQTLHVPIQLFATRKGHPEDCFLAL